MARSFFSVLIVCCSAGFLLIYPAQQATAHPSYGGNCNSCHSSVVPTMSTTPANGGVLLFGNNGYTLVGQTSTANFTVSDTSTASMGGGFQGNFPAASGKFGPTNTQALTTQYGGNLVGPTVAAADGGVSSATRAYTYTPTVRSLGVADTLTVSFTPTVGFPGTAPTSTVTFSGKGVAPVISLVTSTTTSAGSVRIGTTGTASFQVKNVGDGNLAGAGIGNLTGSVAAGASGFTGVGSSFNFTLADNGSQTFSYTFSPTTHGAASAAIAVNATNGSTNNMNQAQSLSATLSGVGVGPTLSTSIVPSTTIDFGQVTSPQTVLRSLTVSNSTTDTAAAALTNLNLISATLSGPSASMFSLAGFTPGTVLAKSGSTNLQLTFAPPSGVSGTETAMLTLVTDEGAAAGASGKTISYPLTGIALGPVSLATAYWKGGQGGNWNTTSPGYNWTSDASGATAVTALPGATTDVHFVASSPGTVATTLGQDFSVKSVTFDAAATSPVTVAGTNTLTVANGVTVAAGSANHTISSKVNLGATQTWSVNGSAKLTASGAISGTGTAGLTKDGSGTLALAAANTYSGGTTVKAGTLQVAHADALPVGGDLAIAGAGTLTALASGLTSAVKVGALSIDSGSATPLATLDLANNELIANKSVTAALKLLDQVKAGYASGAWTGKGVTSSTAAADFAANGASAQTAVGFADNADFGMGLTTFGGRTVDSNSLLMRYTVYGDANLDGKVDLADFALLKHGFGITSGATWDEGDFNYDGKVNLADFAILRSHYSQSLPAAVGLAASPLAFSSMSLMSVQETPEPASISLLVTASLTLGGGALWRYRRRDRSSGALARTA